MLSRSKTASSPTYPAFLLPSLKIPFFRRRQSSATTSSAISNDLPSLSSSHTSAASIDAFPSSPTATPTPLFPNLDVEVHTYELPSNKPASRPTPTRTDPTRPRLASPGFPDVLRCGTCGTDLAYGLQIVSKGFTGRHGRALLVGAPLAASTPSCPGADFSTTSSATTNNPTLRRRSNDVAPGHHALAHESANLINVTVGTPEPRSLVTGAHVVADIRCKVCAVVVGWKYVDAREQAQKYKVGKFILETERTVLVRSWEDGDLGAGRRTASHFYSSSAPVGSLNGSRRCSLLLGGRRKESTSSDGPAGVGAFVEEDEGEENSSAAESEGAISFDSDDEDECEDIFAGVWDAATVARRRGSKVSPSGSQHKGKQARAGRDC